MVIFPHLPHLGYGDDLANSVFSQRKAKAHPRRFSIAPTPVNQA
jgi:hypothetical protein